VIGVVLQIHADSEPADAAKGLPARAAAIGGRLVVSWFLGRARIHGSAAAKSKDHQANQDLAAEMVLGSHDVFSGKYRVY
jgi:hypothetical protein